ncbi:MAG TPA: 2-phospho-L-lactate guanylyltransferase [Aeromicrobium sp.]|nr:2-phospho-L-lactate guanylyltransferase [Aeromicrobium sp.]
MSWTAVVPVKAWRSAKSRLELPPDSRAAMARSMTLVVLDLLTAHPDIEHVVVVTVDADAAREAQARGATVLAEDLGLNEAVRHGCAWIAENRGDGPTVVVPADLGFLTASALSDALAILAEVGRAHVPDLSGEGTTLLAAPSASAITPLYGVGSSAAHAEAGFVRADGVDPCVRADVDRLEDLQTRPA